MEPKPSTTTTTTPAKSLGDGNQSAITAVSKGSKSKVKFGPLAKKAAEPAEVLILQMSEDKTEIKQTLKIQDVIAYRHYVRDLTQEKSTRDWKMPNLRKRPIVSRYRTDSGLETPKTIDVSPEECPNTEKTPDPVPVFPENAEVADEENNVKRGEILGWVDEEEEQTSNSGPEEDVQGEDDLGGRKSKNVNNSNNKGASKRARPQTGLRRIIAEWIRRRKLTKTAETEQPKRSTATTMTPVGSFDLANETPQISV